MVDVAEALRSHLPRVIEEQCPARLGRWISLQMAVNVVFDLPQSVRRKDKHGDYYCHELGCHAAELLDKVPATMYGLIHLVER